MNQCKGFYKIATDGENKEETFLLRKAWHSPFWKQVHSLPSVQSTREPFLVVTSFFKKKTSASSSFWSSPSPSFYDHESHLKTKKQLILYLMKMWTLGMHDVHANRLSKFRIYVLNEQILTLIIISKSYEPNWYTTPC